MRTTDRELKKRHAKLPSDKRKVDTSVNGNVELLAEQHKEVERKLFPLRIDHRTVIYVTKNKRTEEYANKVRQRIGIKVEDNNQDKTTKSKYDLDIEFIKTEIEGGSTYKEVANKLGVSSSVITDRCKKYFINKPKSNTNKGGGRKSKSYVDVKKLRKLVEETNMSLNDIKNELGISSTLYYKLVSENNIEHKRRSGTKEERVLCLYNDENKDVLEIAGRMKLGIREVKRIINENRKNG